MMSEKEQQLATMKANTQKIVNDVNKSGLNQFKAFQTFKKDQHQGGHSTNHLDYK